jgi:hypothetical protein
MTIQRTHRKKSKDQKKPGRLWNIFDWAAVIFVAVFILIGTISAVVPASQSPIPKPTIPTPGNSLVLQVYNGSGEPTAASTVNDFLRGKGVDVRDVIKNSDRIHPTTMILARKSYDPKLDSLAKLVGIPKNRIILQRNADVFDATLLLGKDYKLALPKVFNGGDVK